MWENRSSCWCVCFYYSASLRACLRNTWTTTLVWVGEDALTSGRALAAVTALSQLALVCTVGGFHPVRTGNLSSLSKQVCWDAQGSDAAEVSRLLVNHNWDTKPRWKRGVFLRVLQRNRAFQWLKRCLGRILSRCLTLGCIFSAWFCYRGPWTPPKASVMLSGKQGCTAPKCHSHPN